MEEATLNIIIGDQAIASAFIQKMRKRLKTLKIVNDKIIEFKPNLRKRHAGL